MKNFTTTGSDGPFDIVHMNASKDDYEITENNGILTYTGIKQTYINQSLESIRFDKPDENGLFEFNFADELVPNIYKIDEHTLLYLRGDDFTDSSSNNSIITNYSGSPSIISDEGSNVINFPTGSSLRVAQTINFGGDPFTIAFRVKRMGDWINNSGMILSNGTWANNNTPDGNSATSHGIAFLFSGNQGLQLLSSDGIFSPIAPGSMSATFPIGSYVHVALVSEGIGGNMYCFINGTKIATHPAFYINNTITDMFVASSGDKWNRQWLITDSHVNELSISNVARWTTDFIV